MTSSIRMTHSYLMKRRWRLVRGTSHYTDPETRQVFARSHAAIVQEGRDNEKLKAKALKQALRLEKRLQEVRDWDPHCERIDEIYPPGSVYNKKKPRLR